MRLLGAVLAIAASTFSVPAFAHGLTPEPVDAYFATLLHTLTEMPLPLVLISIGLLLGLNRDVAIAQAWLSLMFGIAGGLTGILAWDFWNRRIRPDE